ncbi:MAG: DUF3135 domain-containing protein [Thermodesulfobacteriota bacterium]
MEWELNKEEREQNALQRHAMLSKLFREDRFTFERERRRMIEEIIESAKDDEQKSALRELQADWDRKMKGAGTLRNRFVLAKTFFWEHFHTVWHPAIEEMNRKLNRGKD